METSDQEQLIDAERTGLYDRALVACGGRRNLATTPEAVDLLALSHRLRDAGDCARHLQGAVLAALFEGDRWRQLRPDLTFPEFCEQEGGISFRTAKNLIDLHVKATKLGLTPERLAGIGWTKARLIVSVATPENVGEWIEVARTTPRSELVKRVAVEKAKRRASGGMFLPSEPLTTLIVKMTLEQKTFVESVIERVATEDPSQVMSRGNALELICVDFVANRLPREKAALWILAQIERVYGVRLQVVEGA